MGELKRQIRARKDAGLMLVRVTTEDGCIWREIKNPDSPFWQDPHDARERNSLRALREEARSRRHTEGSVCRVVTRCMPTVGPFRVKEPTVLVMGNTIDMAAIRMHPLVAKIRHHTRAAWLAGLRLAEMEFGVASRALDQGSHGHVNCPREEYRPPPPLEIDRDYVWEADENPIGAR
jgi:hypothetical protein